MPTLVTLNIFSGRPNPRWFLDDAAAAELRDRLYRKPTTISAAPPDSGALGYRGLDIRFDDSAEPIYIHGGVVRTLAGSPNLSDPDREIERFVLNTMPKGGQDPGLAMTQDVYGLVREHIDKELTARIDLSKLIKIPWPINGKCRRLRAALRARHVELFADPAEQ